MSANPALIQTHGERIPAPFPGELFVLRRENMQVRLGGVASHEKGWGAFGTVYLSNIRMVFVAKEVDPSGLVAFDFPLVYIRKDKLNQPIFGCNNLEGEVWPAVEGGGPAGRLPPHAFALYFKEGGIGTFYPLYHVLATRARAAFEQAQARGAPQPEEAPAAYVQQMVSQAFVDPSDPSIVYLSQPVGPEQALPEAPVYAKNYGVDEKYEPMAPGH